MRNIFARSNGEYYCLLFNLLAFPWKSFRVRVSLFLSLCHSFEDGFGKLSRINLTTCRTWLILIIFYQHLILNSLGRPIFQFIIKLISKMKSAIRKPNKRHLAVFDFSAFSIVVSHSCTCFSLEKRDNIISKNESTTFGEPIVFNIHIVVQKTFWSSPLFLCASIPS